MRSTWQFGLGFELRLASEDLPEAGLEGPMRPGEAAMWLERAAGEGLRGRALVLDVARALSGFAPDPRASTTEAFALARRGLVDGRLRVYVRPAVYEGGGKGPDDVDPPSKPKPPQKDKTFVAIQLLSDEAEPKPVPFKRYKIVLPDQTVREGQLDQAGKAMIPDIDPGTCQVSFPDFDAPDWKAA